MLVKVKLLTGNQTEIDIDPTDTIWRIKERVEEKAGIDPKQQRLIFGGRQLADDRPANEYNIEGGSVLHLVIALRGEYAYSPSQAVECMAHCTSLKLGVVAACACLPCIWSMSVFLPRTQ